MAARKNALGARRYTKPLYLDDTRLKEKIGAEKLIKRLKEFADSRFSPTSDSYMAPHQVTAAMGLLRKVIPDLAAVEHKGEVAIRPVIEPEPTPVEWKEAFAESKQLPAVSDEFDRSVTEEDILKKLDDITDTPSPIPDKLTH